MLAIAVDGADATVRPAVRDPARQRVRIDTTRIVPAGIGEDGQPQLKNNMYVTALE